MGLSHLLPEDPHTSPTATAAASSSSIKREDQDRHAMDVEAGGSLTGSGAPPGEVITNRCIHSLTHTLTLSSTLLNRTDNQY